MALDTLEVFGTEYTNVKGFKAKDDNGNTLAYIRPQGTYTVSGSGTIDVSEYASASVPAGSVTSPSTISDTGASVSTGTNTISLSKTISVTPSVTTAGYVSSGTAGNANVSLTASVTTKGATTYHPSTSDQTISSATYLTGRQTIKAVTTTNLTARNIKSGVTVKIGDSIDDDCIASILGTLTGGLEYESGSYTPSANASRPTISFSNVHTNPPAFVLMSDTSSASGITQNSNLVFMLCDPYRCFGSGFPISTSSTKYGIAYYTYKTSSSTSSNGSQTSSSDDPTSSSYQYYRYFADAENFYPYSISTSRYWRSGRTYKWIAIWK